MPEESDLNENYLCLCEIHVQKGTFIFLSLLLLVSVVNVIRGIMNHDDFYTLGSLIDFGVIVLALIGHRIHCRSFYQPFFVMHLILTFFLSVFVVMLFVNIYERSERRRNVYVSDEEAALERYNYAGPQLLSYIIILLVHSYVMKVIYCSYKYINAVKVRKKSDITALKMLIAREQQTILVQNQDKSDKLVLPTSV